MNEPTSYVFIHIPKTAGTAIRRVATRMFGADGVHAVYHADEILNGFASPVPKPFVIGHFGFRFVASVPGRTRLLTFLRDPRERVLSLYGFWRRLRNHRHHPGVCFAKQHSLLEFLRSDVADVWVQVDNVQTWMLIDDYRVEQRLARAGSTDNELLELARRRLERFDFIGFSESFKPSLDCMAARYGWRLPGRHSYKRHNRGFLRPRIGSLSHAELAELDRLTRLDQIVYQYALERFGQCNDEPSARAVEGGI